MRAVAVLERVGGPPEPLAQPVVGAHVTPGCW